MLPGKIPLAMQREAPRTLASLIENVAEADLARSDQRQGNGQ